MKSLEPYVQFFPTAFPDFADRPYAQLRALMSLYAADDNISFLNEPAFARAMALTEPLVAVKNYKSQVHSPKNLASAVRCIAQIRYKAVELTEDDPMIGVHRADLADLLRLEGFGLPTASAVLHFAHPKHFPIVDKWVAAACKILKERHPTDFDGMAAPRLPQGARGKVKARVTKKEVARLIARYERFIAFIRRICELQSSYRTKKSLRYVDQGLMVLGKPKARRIVEGSKH
jgi:hypothetical protein